MTIHPNQPAETRPPVGFVDAHIHLWDLAGPLSYDWLLGADGGLLGTQSEIAIPDWGGERFNAEVRFHRPSQTVHVQATDPPSNPADETRWLVGQQATSGTPSVIVGRADLRSPDIDAVLDDHLETSAHFRGVRDMSTMGALDDDNIRGGLIALSRRNLSWEVNTTWEQAKDLVDIARALPDLTIVLGHTGWPIERTAGYFTHWSDALNQVAGCPNVTCKVSGLGMTDHRWTVDSMRPYISAALDAFGPNRCMFGSNWPVDRIYASYDALVTGVAAATGDLSTDESTAFWSGTATRTYNLSPEGPT